MLLLVVVFAVVVLSVLAAGGSLRHLVRVRLRGLWLLGAALGLQFVIPLLVPSAPRGLLSAAHIASYVAAGWFLLSNRHVPGWWLVGLGGSMNFLAIVANGGRMPASPTAVASAGLVEVPGAFANSVPIADPNLGFLGDVFAVPDSWPLSNVFSLGDICVALGAAVALHMMCRSRLIPSGRGEFASLFRQRDFSRVWAAQAVSNLGDWIYALAISVSLAARVGTARALASMLIIQTGAAAVAGLLGGPAVDRFSRKHVMIVADLVRATAVMSLLLVREPSLAHLYLVAACLGTFEAIFQSSLQASIPNLVPKGSIVAANALVSLTFNVAIMAGPVVGGIVVASLGLEPALALNAASFAVSGLLIVGVRLGRGAGGAERASPRADLVLGLRYAVFNPLVRSVLVVTGLVMFSAALRTPVEPLFITRTLGYGPQALGWLGTAWGVGMVLGSVAAPAAVRAWARERLLWVSVAAVGVCVLATSQATVLTPVLVLGLLSGFGNAIGTVSYESMLQERTPDAVRGRVVAVSEAVLNASFLLGAALAGWLGDRAGVRTMYALAGALFVATALASRVLIRSGAAGRTGRVAAAGAVRARAARRAG